MFRQTIKTNIIVLFLLLVGVVSFSLLTSQYYFNVNLAESSTAKTFELISNNISESLDKDRNKMQRILNANKHNDHFYKTIEFKNNEKAFHDLAQMLTINEGIYAMYYAHKDGSFYEMINMDSSEMLYNLYEAPKETRWLSITNINNVAQYSFYNKDQKLLSKVKKEKKYNPLVRPWYTQALASKTGIRTAPYLFSNLQKSGITNAIELDQEGSVFAIDYTLDSLNAMLALQKFDEESEIFVFNKHGSKFASSNIVQKNIQKSSKVVKSSIKFTEQEKKYLNKKTPIIFSNEDDWAPYDFKAAAKPMGYSVDLIKLLAEKSSLNIEFVNGFTWTKIMQMFVSKDIDVVQSVYKTDEREKMGTFSKPIYSFKNYFITTKENTVSSIKDLEFKKVAIVEGWASGEFLKKNYPNIELVEYKDMSSALMSVSKYETYALVDTPESFVYLTKHLYINNLKKNFWFKEFDGNKAQSIYLLVQNDNPILLSILNKALDSLTEEELQILYNNWFSTDSKKADIDMIDKTLAQALKSDNNDKIIRYTDENKEYFTMYKRLHDENTFLGIKVNTKTLFEPYNKNMKYSLIIALVLLMLSIPLIFLAANIIIKPIRALKVENEKIKQRQFDDVKKIDTNIIEFIELSDSLVSMSQSIKEFQVSQAEMLDSIVKLIAEAVDAKSAYTGGHCERVPEIAQLLVDKASSSEEGIFKDFKLTTEDELREFEIGAWLHDCGKVTTPEYVVDKSTKLETINDRIHEVRTRFEVLWRDAQVEYLQAQLDSKDKKESLDLLHKKQEQLTQDFTFIANANIGGEFMDKDKQARVREIANQEWTRNFDDSLGLGEVEILRYDKDSAQELPASEKLLSDKKQHIIKRTSFDYEAYERDGFKEDVPQNLYNYGEVYNLCIEKGTLSLEERYKINEHVILSIKMLEKIPFPAHMTRIPEYAGTHHETLIGTGYPRKLTKYELSIPARIMALADVFEALTASDRPYKKAKTLSASVKIMSFMVKEKHLDEDIFKLFLSSGLHKVYAQKYLKPEQIDEVDIEQYI